MFLCQDFDYMGVTLIVHLFSQVIPALAVAMVVLFALVRVHDYVALHSHAFDFMSFLPEVTSQPSHISVCGIVTHSSVSSVQPCIGRSSSLRVTSILLGSNTINRHSAGDCSMSSSSSTFASFIVADIVSLFGQALRQMPRRFFDDLILALLVSPETLFSLPCCPFSSFVCVRLRFAQSTRIDVAHHRDRPSLHATHQ